MIFLAALLGQAGYTLLYAGATGRYWQQPWAYVEESLGHKVPTTLSDPEQADEFAAALLGVLAFKALLSNGSGLLSSLGNNGGGGGGGGGGEDQAEKTGAGDAGAAEEGSESVLSRIGSTLKTIFEGGGGGEL
jgi:hypothetical protein